MKNIHYFILTFIIFSIIGYSQNSDSNIKEGDVFIVGEVHNDDYEHINFPRPNLIIKRGGIVNYDNIKGKKVEVTSIKENKNGSLIATIKLISRKSFFGSHKYIKVDITKAILNRELLKV